MRTITLAVIASLSTAAHLGDEDAPTANQLWDTYNTGTDTLSMDDFEFMYNETVAEDLAGDETMSALNLWNTAEHGLSFGEWEQVYWMVADWYSYNQGGSGTDSYCDPYGDAYGDGCGWYVGQDCSGTWDTECFQAANCEECWASDVGDDYTYSASSVCSNMATPGDSALDGCNQYLTNPGWCGGYDTADFHSADCCACQDNFAGLMCSDADWPQDSAADGCDQYILYPSWCGSGSWDTADFASSNCCACQAEESYDTYVDYYTEEYYCDPTADSYGDGCDWYWNGSCDGTWDTECFQAMQCEGCMFPIDQVTEEYTCDPTGDSYGDGCDWYWNGSCDGTWDTECFSAMDCEGCWNPSPEYYTEEYYYEDPYYCDPTTDSYGDGCDWYWNGSCDGTWDTECFSAMDCEGCWNPIEYYTEEYYYEDYYYCDPTTDSYGDGCDWYWNGSCDGTWDTECFNAMSCEGCWNIIEDYYYEDYYYESPSVCSNMAAPGDTWDDGCNEYLTNPDWCGSYDSDTFNSADCCACQGNFAGEFCSDADWPQDSAADGCDQYILYPSWCGSGSWDTADFASSNCCACQATDADFIDNTPDVGGDYFVDETVYYADPVCDPSGDSYGDGCDWYVGQDCSGTWDTECFQAANCVECSATAATSCSNEATPGDTYGDGCDQYLTYPSWCGNYDHSGFYSADCCACQN